MRFVQLLVMSQQHPQLDVQRSVGLHKLLILIVLLSVNLYLLIIPIVQHLVKQHKPLDSSVQLLGKRRWLLIQIVRLSVEVHWPPV